MAEREYPTDSDFILKVGESFHLVQPIVLMGQNNAEEWFANGCPSMKLPVGTKIQVIQTVKDARDWTNTQVAAYLPNEHNGYKGWIDTFRLALQHPILQDNDKRRKQLRLQDTRAEELKMTNLQQVADVFGISQEVLESIFREGFYEKQWPY